MSLIHVNKNLGRTFQMTAKDSDGDAVVPGANDKLRVRILRTGQSEKLNFTSEAPTDNGSSITKDTVNGVNSVRLDASDLTFPAGVYSFFFELFDNADSSEWKLIDRQVFCLEE